MYLTVVGFVSVSKAARTLGRFSTIQISFTVSFTSSHTSSKLLVIFNYACEHSHSPSTRHDADVFFTILCSRSVVRLAAVAETAHRLAPHPPLLVNQPRLAHHQYLTNKPHRSQLFNRLLPLADLASSVKLSQAFSVGFPVARLNSCSSCSIRLRY